MIRSIIATSIALFCLFEANGQTTEKQLRDSLSITKDDITKINLLIKLSRAVNTHSADSAMLLAQNAMVIAKRSENEKNIARSYRAVGRVFYNQGKYSSAIENYKNAFIHSQRIHDSVLLSTELDDLGRSYRRIGEPKQALQYLQQGLDIATAAKDKEMVGEIYNNMALVLNDSGDDSLALKYYHNSLTIAEELKDTSTIILSLNNIGYQYFRLKNLQKEEEYFLKALALVEKTKDQKMYGVTYDNIGSMWADRGDTQKAIVYFLKALEYERKTGVKAYIAEELKSLTEICIKMKNYQMAFKYANEGYQLSEQIQSAELRAVAAKNLAIVFEKLRQFEQSLTYLKIANTIFDSLNSIEKTKVVSNLASRYELNKKESEIKSLNFEKEAQKTELQLQNRIKYGLIIFLLLVTTLLVIAIYQYRERQKANDQLVIWSSAVDQKNKQLDNLNKVKDKIFSSIAHDIKSPLSSIQGLLSLMNTNLLTQEEFNKLIVELSARVNTTTSLLENLLNWSRNQIATAKANPVPTNIRGLSEECLSLYNTNAIEKNIAFFNSISEKAVVYADEEMIRIVLRNLISNAIKFTKPNGAVKLDAIAHENFMSVSIADSGIGISESDLNTIFGYEAKTTHGTAQEKGTGLGLILCKEFIEKNGGKIWVESTLNKGSIFSFTVPVPNQNG
ncbi:MAG TPA: tetratricopeptide repeat-containing sensor histidine kinase [Cyclobacteriaceae bacterium]|jgi:signal transduction histidine kinase|nr:tetratricopeptide repeat-containing sensor histidine kinase [Cyclobacteriaceae bacterium]